MIPRIGFLILIGLLTSVAAQETGDQDLVRLRADLKADPDNRSVRLLLAKKLIERRQFSEAADLHKQAFEEGRCTGEELRIHAVARMMNYAGTVITWRLLSKLPVIEKFQQDMPAAKRALAMALEKDPNDHEAVFLMAMLSKIDGDNKKAEEFFQLTIERSPALRPFYFDDPWIEYAAFLKSSERDQEAAALLRRRVDLDTTDTWPMVALSIGLLELKQTDEASRYFYRGLRNIRDADRLKTLYAEASPIASDEEQQQWGQLSDPADQSNFLRIFWKKRDPNPVDEANERWAEHYLRLAHARASYPKIRPPYYDDRGFIHIRYGKPDQFHAGDRDESWVYEKENRFFDFVDVGNGFYELRPLSDAIPNDVMGSDRLTYLLNLVSQRRNLHSFYEQSASKIESQMGRVHVEANARQVAARLAGIAMQYEQDYNVRGAGSAIGGRFDFETGVPDILINTDAATFRAANGSRLDFSFIVPLQQLNYLPVATEGESSFLTVRVRILDSLYHEVQLIEKRYSHSVKDSSTAAGYFILDEFRCLVPPGRYVLGMDLRNNRDEKIGIYRIPLTVRKFNAASLEMSDLQTALVIAETPSADRFVKPGTRLRVVPNPAGYKTRNQPLNVYYEIYGLTLNDEGRSAYEVSYTIAAEKPGFLSGLFSGGKQGSVSLSTRKSGVGTTEYEFSGFDITNLKPGRYILKVEVRDLWSGLKTRRQTSLQIQ